VSRDYPHRELEHRRLEEEVIHLHEWREGQEPSIGRGQVAPHISEACEWESRGLGVKGREVRGREVARKARGSKTFV
jgi:hypothetical protein